MTPASRLYTPAINNPLANKCEVNKRKQPSNRCPIRLRVRVEGAALADP